MHYQKISNMVGVGVRVPLAAGIPVATVGQLLFAPGPGLTQPSILSGSVNRVPACMAGVVGGVCSLVSGGR